MTIVRRFLVVQGLLLWQGGFFFYALVVVPTGTEVLGAFAQGRVTRHVTETMNAIAVAALSILAWDQWRNPESSRFRKARWALWTAMVIGLAALFVLHRQIVSHVDFAGAGRIHDYPAFYQRHRFYLCVAAAQWVAGLAYVAVMLRAWSFRPASP
jgi:hypothetical protein